MRLDIAKVLEKGYFVYREGIYMKVTYREDSKMNHYEMQLVVHPKNRRLAKLLAKQFKETLGEIEVLDEYRNKYPLSLLAVYYFEMVDHKMFVYTENEVFRLHCVTMAALKEAVESYGFYQVNVRTLVNVKHVVKYKKQKGCRRQMILDNGDRLISSRHYREEFDRMIEERHESRILEKDPDNLSHEK